MNHPSNSRLFPWAPLFAGVLGFCLQCWLFSAMDSSGLLPKNHIAEILSFILLALTLGICLIGLQNVVSSDAYHQLFPPSRLAAAGTLLGGIGIACSAFAPQTVGFLKIIVPVFGVLSGVALAIAAYCRLHGVRPNCLLHSTVAVYLIFRIMACCRNWGAEPQVQRYFFQLLACLSLLLACYYRAELDVHEKGIRQYVFFSQVALFCCCLCLPGTDRLFYLSAAVWMAADYCTLHSAGRYAA